MLLKRSEKEFLFSKYKKNGMNSIDADIKVKSICNYLELLVLKLRKKKIKETDINKKFQEEFEKLCMRY